jgi:hypothetical protein
MTLEELENTLPNGLHDAEVKAIAVDYETASVTLRVDIWVGSMDDPRDKREAYKSGHLEITGLIFLVMEPPDSGYAYKNGPELIIDAVGVGKGLDTELLKTVPIGAFVRTFWVNQWNACMHVAASNAEIQWMNEGAITYR